MRVTLRNNNDIDLADLIRNLKIKGFPVDKTMIAYYSYVFDMYVYCGSEPLPNRTYIPGREVARTTDNKNQLTIRLRQSPQSINMIPENLIDIETNVKMEPQETITQHGIQAKQKRTKERKIGEILNKVCLWRKLYNGYTDPASGETIKMSLEEAAGRVAISKKSLDDYLLQIRFGKKYGFNFNDHANDRVGVLRAYVKKFKTKNQDKYKEIAEVNSKFPPEFAKMIDKKAGRKYLEPPTLKQLPPPPNLTSISTRTRSIRK